MLVKVPATIMTSLCLGLARKMIPSRSWSYLGVDTCIISTAQQARPKVIGQMEPCLAQLTTCNCQRQRRIGFYSVGTCKDIIHDSFLWFARALHGWCLRCAGDRRDGGVRSLDGRHGQAATAESDCAISSFPERKGRHSRFTRLRGTRVVLKAIVIELLWIRT